MFSSFLQYWGLTLEYHACDANTLLLKYSPRPQLGTFSENNLRKIKIIHVILLYLFHLWIT